VFVEGGAICAATSLIRMLGYLGGADLDALIPAGRTSRGKIIDPPPFSAQLCGVVDPLSTGLIAFSARSIGANLTADDPDHPHPPSPRQLVEALAAAEGVRLLPYPEFVATLPRRRAMRGVPVRLPTISSPGYREQWVRWLVMQMLRSPLGGAVPYGIRIAEGLPGSVRRLKCLFASGLGTAWD
jgi:hypothetical protein